MENALSIIELSDKIIAEMSTAGFSEGTIAIYKRIFARLHKLAAKRNELYFSTDLGLNFIADSNYTKKESYCHSRYCLHCRVIQFLESYIKTGVVDWSVIRGISPINFSSNDLTHSLAEFDASMLTNGLKANTRDGYHRFVSYFLRYLSDKGYTSLNKIQNGDVMTFITIITRDRYSTTSLGAHLPGLKLFLKLFKHTEKFVHELPEHLPKKVDILNVYSDIEHHKMINYLNNSEITSRDRAISLLALETGLRAVDICNLKLSNIDWEYNVITIVQEKNNRPLVLPLKESIGNAIVDYLLNERPVSRSEFIFLRFEAPFEPIKTHAACHKILFKTATNAGVEANGRIFGTRITRHSTASRLLRQGVPLPVISEVLGHSNPDSSMRYITTDNVKLAECTLPLPVRRNQDAS